MLSFKIVDKRPWDVGSASSFLIFHNSRVCGLLAVRSRIICPSEYQERKFR
jgi:hypothetical protein